MDIKINYALYEICVKITLERLVLRFKMNLKNWNKYLETGSCSYHDTILRNRPNDTLMIRHKNSASTELTLTSNEANTLIDKITQSIDVYKRDPLLILVVGYKQADNFRVTRIISRKSDRIVALDYVQRENYYDWLIKVGANIGIDYGGQRVFVQRLNVGEVMDTIYDIFSR
jgi:hypothetical protein